MSTTQPSWQEVYDLVAQLDGGDFDTVAIRFGDVSVRMSRTGHLPPVAGDAPPPPAAPAPTVAAAPPPPAPIAHQAPGPEEAGEAHPSANPPGRGEPVPSPMLGTFYRSPSPGAPPYVEVGDRVEPDTLIGIIEVMKLMNPVSAGFTGSVVSFSVQDGEPVEFGQELLRVEA